MLTYSCPDILIADKKDTQLSFNLRFLEFWVAMCLGRAMPSARCFLIAARVNAGSTGTLAMLSFAHSLPLADSGNVVDSSKLASGLVLEQPSASWFGRPHLLQVTPGDLGGLT